MKKKILLSILVLIGLFTITGCGNTKESNNSKSKEDDNIVYVTVNNEKYELNSETELNRIHFLENYVDFDTSRVGYIKSIYFAEQEELFFEINIIYEDGKSFNEVKEEISKDYDVNNEKTKEINNIKYSYYERTNSKGNIVHYYLCEYENEAYSIIFTLGKNAGNIEEVFMNNVKKE